MAHLHNLRNPILHGDFKVSDVIIPAKTLEPKITNFGLWDFKKFFIENTLPGVFNSILDSQNLRALCSVYFPYILRSKFEPCAFEPEPKPIPPL